MLALAVLVWLTVDVLTAGPISRFDHVVAEWAWSTGIRRGNLPRKAAVALLTLPGNWRDMVPLFGAFVVWLSWSRRTVQPLLRGGVAVAVLVGVVVTFKALVGRTAPLIDHVLAGGRSFPSGHVTTAVVCWGMAAWLAARYGVAPLLRRLLAVAAFVAPVATAVGMVLLDYHWLSDLVAGVALGTLLLRVVGQIFAGRLGDWGHGGAADPASGRRAAGAALVGSGGGG